jgi:hypothetical protein
MQSDLSSLYTISTQSPYSSTNTGLYTQSLHRDRNLQVPEDTSDWTGRIQSMLASQLTSMADLDFYFSGGSVEKQV